MLVRVQVPLPVLSELSSKARKWQSVAWQHFSLGWPNPPITDFLLNQGIVQRVKDQNPNLIRLMASSGSLYKKQIPLEFLPSLLKLLQVFRESVMPAAEDTFRTAFTMVEELWVAFS